MSDQQQHFMVPARYLNEFGGARFVDRLTYRDLMAVLATFVEELAVLTRTDDRYAVWNLHHCRDIPVALKSSSEQLAEVLQQDPHATGAELRAGGKEWTALKAVGSLFDALASKGSARHGPWNRLVLDRPFYDYVGDEIHTMTLGWLIARPCRRP